MAKKRKSFKSLELFIITTLLIQKVQGAPPLRIGGSSAVFPFAATVAEHFSYKTHQPIPLVEAIGTGAGIKLFCGNINGLDGVITSRPLTQAEREKCTSQGIPFEEFTIGQDGLVLIQSKKVPPFSLTLKDLNEALAEKISQGKTCIPNPYKTWNEIQKDFPIYPIRVLGPAPSSGTYDVLVEKTMGPCGPFLRRDGAYIEAPANENLIVQKVLNAPHTIGIVTYSFYDQNRMRLHALPLEGILPSVTSIQMGNYYLSRPLYLYVKTNYRLNFSILRDYVIEFTSSDAIGEQGYLTEKGLIPLSAQEQDLMHKRALGLRNKDAQ